MHAHALAATPPKKQTDAHILAYAAFVERALLEEFNVRRSF
jgi:hypothetical protein